MARRSLDIIVPSPHGAKHQNYTCRDCPARCCKTWSVTVTPAEAERIAADPNAVARLDERAAHILSRGHLPMHVRAGELECVFLDEDDLCSLHKRHGHEFLPQACQAYPFGVSQDERQRPVALLSRYCPSIARNDGAPIAPILAQKLGLLAPPRPMSPRMGLRSGRTLPLSQYVRLVDTWRAALDTTSDLPQTLLSLFAWTEAVDQALPARHAPSDDEWAKLLAAHPWSETQTQPAARSTWSGRLLSSLLLGAISHPLHLLQPVRTSPVHWKERWGAFWTRLKWLLGRGRVHLLWLSQPTQLGALSSVDPCWQGEPGRAIAQYLSEVLARRQGMHRSTYLHRFLVELGLMAVVAGRYARAHALSQGNRRVGAQDAEAGIGVAELLLTHQGELGQNRVLDQLRLQLLSNPESFGALLSAEH